MRRGPRPTFRRASVDCEVEEVSLSKRERLAIKEAAYREALQQAWFATALEQTKSVFTLASAGVGLAQTLIFTGSLKRAETWAPTWLLLSAVTFAVSAGLCVWVFRVNGKLVSKLVKDHDHSFEDQLVGRLDRASRFMFGAGIIFLLFAAVSQIWLK